MKVVVTRKVFGPAVDLLQAQGFTVVVNPEDRVLSVEELKEFVAGADGILSLLTDKITGEVMGAAGKQLKIVANYAVGFDNVDLEAAKERKILVTNTPGVLTEAVAEHTFAVLLAVARRIVEADAFVRAGKFHVWEPELLLGTQLSGKKMGVVGLGRIGSVVAKIAHNGFGMNICYHTHAADPEVEKQTGACFYDNLMEMLPEIDVISLHVPLTSETTHMISRRELSAMKKSAILVNTARGQVVDEEVLLEALEKGWISGAGLDVFEHEDEQVNPRFYKLPNVVLTPHIASATIEARGEMSRLAAENIITALSGEVPPNLAK